MILEAASLVGVGLSVSGAITSFVGASQQQAANADAVAAQQRAEAARFKAMKIDADRRRRQLIRQAQIASAQALATGVAQGASKGSALPGAYGQIAGQLGFGLTGVNQQEALGTELFAANQQLLQAKLAGASAATTSALGQSFTSVGNTIIGNLDKIGRVGDYATGQFNNLFAPNTIAPNSATGVRGLY